jgi:hypothetical protein
MTDLVLEIPILPDHPVYTMGYTNTGKAPMQAKKAFSNGRSAAARLPVESGIKAGDAINVTVLGPGKVLIERDAELPDYSFFLPKRSKSGGNVTSELVARILEESGS